MSPWDTKAERWIERHRFLVISLGLLAMAGFAVAIFALIQAMITRSGAYELGMESLLASPAAGECLGQPIERNGFPMGDIRYHNSAGTARFTIPVAGPKARGTLYLQATREDALWSLRSLELETGEACGRIFLVQPSR